MYSYKLGHYGWESTGFIWLTHEKEYTQKEFEEFVISVTPSIAKKYQIEQVAKIKEIEENEPEKIPNRLKQIEDWMKRVSFHEIYEEVAQELSKQFGFSIVKPTATCAVWEDDLFAPSDIEDDAFLVNLHEACLKEA